MEHRYINELEAGLQIEDQVFMIASKDLRSTNNGSLYIHAVLADKTGQLLSRAWQATEEQYKAMPDGGFMRFRGRTESYKGHLQFIIDGMKAIELEEVNIADFMPSTDRDVDEMWEQVKTILRTIEDRDLLEVIKLFVQDEQLVARFKRAPAAVTMHHAYVGGLLEHTLNLLELAQVVIPRYPELSMDLVLAGLFLHDLGKTEELRYDTNFQYTDQGQLIGHIVHCVIWIEEKTKAIAEATGKPFPEDKKWALQHVILSHHGEYEFGSPKLPAMPEAIAIHYLDNLDAKVFQCLAAIDKAKDEDSNWTEYVRALERRIYKRDVFGVKEKREKRKEKNG